MTVSISSGTAEDLPEIQRLQCRVHGAKAWDLVSWEVELARPNGMLWIARADHGDPMGYLLAWRVVDRIEIVDLVVCPEHRRQGIARALVGLMKSLSIQGELTAIGLEVREDNKAGVALYQALGFSVTQEIHGFYDDGESALRMMWPVAKSRI